MSHYESTRVDMSHGTMSHMRNKGWLPCEWLSHVRKWKEATPPVSHVGNQGKWIGPSYVMTQVLLQALQCEAGKWRWWGTERGGAHILISQSQCLAMCACMLHPRFQATPQENAKCPEENSHVTIQSGRKPIRTYMNKGENQWDTVTTITYILSALCESMSITSCLSPTLHFCIFLSDCTAESM